MNDRPDTAAIRDGLGGGVIAVLRRILSENGRAYAWHYAITIVCLILIGMTTAFVAWITRDVVDEIFVRQRGDLIIIITGTVIGVFLLRGIAMYVQAVVLARIGNDLVARYQSRVFDKLMKLGIGYFTEARSGHLSARIAENVNGIRDVLSLTLTALGRDLISLIGLLVVMVTMDPMLSLIVFSVAPILILAVAWVSARIRNVVRETVELNARVVGTMQEAVQGITVVKAFTMEERLGARIGAIIDDARSKADRLAGIIERVNPAAEVFAGLAVAGVIAYAGLRAVNEGQPPGATFAFITALLLAADPARRLGQLKVNLEKSMVNARMIYEILDMPERQSDRADAAPLTITEGGVRFEDVDFAYGDGTKVLHGLTFAAPAHKTTAIVGPSGAGKTTIIALLQRFYDIDAGRIEIDGQDIAGVTLSSLRGQMAFVSQQPYLFEGTIRQNIGYGRPDATDAEIEAAARQANAHDFIMEQAQGYDTPVGENGVTLSGGQRQRISIARAIVRDAPILLLDEATSALDNESEKLVQQALEDVMAGRTTIVIAHRLSTIVSADRIVVMDKGVVVETGTHAELASRKGGLYAKLNMLGAGTDPDAAEPILETDA
ncbi:MAG: ABC transporter ATP-binding protein [Roseitalea sp.]|nr:ABC transporter ATP-binding protein [Roseitalea sp.]MBO6953022.1 ABC transporter ATP-binding protein [Rhizobiaceae bacterium]MBO6593369.1 ABC transporter ATP-binding protein [Roseitalea sp.]MBO6600641.1 ABC transporter ATP-binding protein [Roseitalea sp.]MBO6612322.1 ABC transporter ATP-binding protein [Roseitalea sp.]